jgi:hypothetical protein
MLAMLLLTWVVIQLVQVIRAKETVTMVIAIVGAILAVLICLGILPQPPCVRL